MFDLSSTINVKSKGTFTLPLEDAEVHYIPQFLDKTLADKFFNHLYQDIQWKEEPITLFGKTYMQPRLTALYGEKGLTYSYSNLNMKALPFTKDLLSIKKKSEPYSEAIFNSVLLNLYRDGQDSNGWHSDDEAELGPNPVIASISLGASRYFQFKHKKKSNQRYKLLLGHGSLLVMKGDTQKCWYHQIPKTKKFKEPRINLTFRRLFPTSS